MSQEALLRTLLETDYGDVPRLVRDVSAGEVPSEESMRSFFLILHSLARLSDDIYREAGQQAEYAIWEDATHFALTGLSSMRLPRTTTAMVTAAYEAVGESELAVSFLACPTDKVQYLYWAEAVARLAKFYVEHKPDGLQTPLSDLLMQHYADLVNESG